MKKINLLILPLLALSMIGCSKTTTSVTSSSTPTSEKTSSSSYSSSSEKKSSTSSSSKAEEAVSSTLDVYSIGWSRDVTDKMLKYLDNTVLPYVKLSGKSSDVEANWVVSADDFGKLEISGLYDWDEEKSPTSFTDAYTQANWTIDENTTSSFKATDPTGKIHITAGPRSTVYFAPDTTLTIRATIDETYDKTKSLGAWDSEVLQVFNDNFGAVAPFVYLGLNHPGVEFDGYNHSVVISGNEWNDSIMNDAMDTLEKAGYSLVSFGDGKLVMKGNVTNSNDQFEITINKSYNTIQKITMTCKFIEYFNPSVANSWDSNVTQEMNDKLDNHVLPYLYLGTKIPSFYYEDFDGKLYIRGVNTMTTEQVTTVLNNSKDVFKSDDWETVYDGIEYLRYITYKKTFPDNHVITVKVQESISYGIEMECSISKALDIPTDAKNWTKSTEDLMNEKFGRVLPYVYLNTTTETATWNESSSTMTITGGAWLPAIGEHVKETYDNVTDDDGNKLWPTVTLVEMYGYVTMVGNYDGDTFRASLISDGTNAVLNIVYIKKYEAKQGSWSEDVTDQFTENLHGHSIPYVYLRTDNPDVYFYEDAKILAISGGAYDSGMMDDMKVKFTEDDGWTVMTDTSYADDYPVYKVQKDFGDGCILEVEMSGGEGVTSQIRIHLKNYYDSKDTSDKWDDDAETEIQNMSGLDLPYVYLGTQKVTVSYDQDDYNDYFTERLYVRGGGWSNEIVTKANTAFKAKGYTCYESENIKGKTLIGYKKDNTEKTMISFYIFKDPSNSLASMYVWKSALSSGAIPTDGIAWGDDFDTKFKKFTKNDDYTLPQLSFGSTPSFIDYGSYAEVTVQELLTHERSFIVYEQLLADNWTVNMENSGDTLKITAEKELENHAKVSLVFDDFFGGLLRIRYYEPFVAPEGEDAVWSKAVKSTLNSYLGHTLPYIYLGTDNPEATYNEYLNRVEIKGGTWDDRIYTIAKEAFDDDKDENGLSYWTYMYDYSSVENGDTLIASRTFDDGMKMTVKVYSKTEDDSTYPMVEVYCL